MSKDAFARAAGRTSWFERRGQSWAKAQEDMSQLSPKGLFNFDEKGAFYMLILLTNKKR